MSSLTLAQQMRHVIDDLNAECTTTIYVDNLIDYLREVEKSSDAEPSELVLAKYKAVPQNWVESNNYAQKATLKHFRSVITAGQSAIQSSFLLHGGGGVVLLAFIGHVARFNAAKVAEFGARILPIAFGVLAIAVTSGLTCLSQWLYASSRHLASKAGSVLNVACIVFVLVSYACFSRGLFVADRGVSELCLTL